MAAKKPNKLKHTSRVTQFVYFPKDMTHVECIAKAEKFKHFSVSNRLTYAGKDVQTRMVAVEIFLSTQSGMKELATAFNLNLGATKIPKGGGYFVFYFKRPLEKAEETKLDVKA